MEKKEKNTYIKGAGACIVTKSILDGTSRLKWMFREDNGIGNGWCALGDSDSQAYVDDAKNLAVVDFNTLAGIEPVVWDIYFMPYGADLEFRSDAGGKYFVDVKTGAEIREPVKHPMEAAFEKNLKFLNQKEYPPEFFTGLFRENGRLRTVAAGEADFPSGTVVLADPLAYLGTKYQTVLKRRIPAGSYPVVLSVMESEIAGSRVAAAKFRISGRDVKAYEIAEAEGVPGKAASTFFGVDPGTACFADQAASEEFCRFLEKWRGENPGKNLYADYFEERFRERREDKPGDALRRWDLLCWAIPESGRRLVMFSSGVGDGIYSGYWGLDADGEPAELIVPFLNPEYF